MSVWELPWVEIPADEVWRCPEPCGQGRISGPVRMFIGAAVCRACGQEPMRSTDGEAGDG